MRINFISLLFAILAIGPISMGAQSLPTKEEAAGFLQKAAEAANLRTADSPPFHLMATIHYEIGHRSLDGTYEFLWVSPDKYRETFKMVDAEEVEIALGDKLYILRNTQAMTLPLWSTRKTLKSLKNFYPGSAPKVKKVYSAQVGGKTQLCVDFGDDSLERQACFEPITNEVVSLHYAAIPPHGPLSITTKELKHLYESELRDFANMAAKRHPLQIVEQDSDEKLEIKIESLTQVKALEENEFVPPAGAAAHDWCSNPIAKGNLEFPFQPILEMDPPGAVFAYYVVVGTDGRVTKWLPARSGGSRVDDQMATRLRMAKFPIFSCGNKPIGYETMFNAPIQIRLPHY
jgi:hypothetical protein